MASLTVLVQAAEVMALIGGGVFTLLYCGANVSHLHRPCVLLCACPEKEKQADISIHSSIHSFIHSV